MAMCAQAAKVGLAGSGNGSAFSTRYASKPCMAVCNSSMARFTETPEARWTEGKLKYLTFDSTNYETSETQLPIAHREDADRKVSWRCYS